MTHRSAVTSESSLAVSFLAIVLVNIEKRREVQSMKQVQRIIVDNVRWWWIEGAECTNKEETLKFYHDNRMFIRCICIRTCEGSNYYDYLVKKLNYICKYYENQLNK